MTATIEETRMDTSMTNTGEPKYAHYAESVSVTEGYVLGKTIVALCGKLFIPSRDPKKFPVCPICKEIAESVFSIEE